MQTLLETIRNRKNGTATPEDQVSAASFAWRAYFAVKRHEEQMHRPGNLAFLVILAVVVVAAACAYWVTVGINSIPD